VIARRQNGLKIKKKIEETKQSQSEKIVPSLKGEALREANSRPLKPVK
jgi:hypothetical protein